MIKKLKKQVSGSGRKSYAIMEADGNFVLYDGYGNSVWASNTGGNPGSRVNIQGADMYIEDSNEHRIANFLSNTTCR